MLCVSSNTCYVYILLRAGGRSENLEGAISNKMYFVATGFDIIWPKSSGGDWPPAPRYESELPTVLLSAELLDCAKPNSQVASSNSNNSFIFPCIEFFHVAALWLATRVHLKLDFKSSCLSWPKLLCIRVGWGFQFSELGRIKLSLFLLSSWIGIFRSSKILLLKMKIHNLLGSMKSPSFGQLEQTLNLILNGL